MARRREDAHARPVVDVFVARVLSWMRTPAARAAWPARQSCGSSTAASVLAQKPPRYVGDETSARILLVEDLVLVVEALVEPADSESRRNRAARARRSDRGELDVAVDAMALEVGKKAREVLTAEPLELLDLIGEAREAVLDRA